MKVRDRCFKDVELHKRIWEVYYAKTKADFQQRMDSFKEWFSDQKSKACVVEMTSKLWKRADQYAIAYEHPNCYRTSNQVDRPMNRIKRVLYSGRGLHGHRQSSELHLRGVSLLTRIIHTERFSDSELGFEHLENRLGSGLGIFACSRRTSPYPGLIFAAC